MHRSWPILLAITALLAGCSSGSSTPATVTVTSPVPAVESPAAADPDPTNAELFSSQFHPCEVFTEEQFAQAGLGKRLNVAEDPMSRVKACSFSHQDTELFEGSFFIGTDTVDRHRIEELQLESLSWPDPKVGGIYVHRMPSSARSCSAALDVSWGRLFIDYTELGQGWDPEALCAEPVDILISLITQFGGNNAA